MSTCVECGQEVSQEEFRKLRTAVYAWLGHTCPGPDATPQDVLEAANKRIATLEARVAELLESCRIDER